MLLSHLLHLLDTLAPLKFAESWDNVGLIVGDPNQDVARTLLAIDYTPAVAEEARGLGCEFVIAYHPPLFHAVKRLTAPDLLFDAIRRGVAVYSPHTALDVAQGGTNDLLADLLGLQERQPLRLNEPKAREYKLITFVPEKAVDAVAAALFAAGAGHIGHYSQCSFRIPGIGTFQGDELSHPTVGTRGKYEETSEVRIETICPIERVPQVLAALRAAHPYEEPAFDLTQLATPPEKTGQGRIGTLAPTRVPELVERVKKGLGLSKVLIAGPTDGLVTRAAVLAGGGREHLKDAIAQGAQLYLTGEIPHHDALAAARAGVTVVATLHSNSERATLGRVRDYLAKEAPQVDFVVSKVDRDPFEVV